MKNQYSYSYSSFFRLKYHGILTKLSKNVVNFPEYNKSDTGNKPYISKFISNFIYSLAVIQSVI